MNEPYLIEGAVPQSLANLIRESKGEPATTKYLPAQFYSELHTIINSGRYLIKRASGAIASFNDAVAAPLVGLRVALPWRSEGYDSVEVTRCGKNLLDATTGVTSNAGWVVRYYTSLPANTYRISSSIGIVNGFGVSVANRAGRAGQETNVGYPRDSPFSYNVTESIGILRFDFNSGGNDKNNIILAEVQIEPGSTATAYEPYNGNTYTVTLPTTIYGGYLDAVTGQLVATHDANGNLLTNQKLYFLPPVNINALVGVNNVWSNAGDVTVSYRVEQ